MEDKVKREKKEVKYRSPEARARQLAGLSGVDVKKHVPEATIEKLNGQGPFASVSDEKRKEILELFCAGHSCRYIEEKTGFGRQTIDDIKRYYLDNDSQFRNAFFKSNLKQKLQTVIDGAADRLIEAAPEMSGKEAALTLGIAMDKYLALEKNSGGPEQLHQHVHIHGVSEIGDAFKMALQPKKHE
jgi:hypothetical protein